MKFVTSPFTKARCLRVTICCLSLYGSMITSEAQAPSRTATRDARASSAIQASLLAMTIPGATLETDLESVTASGNLENSTPDGNWESLSFFYMDLLSDNSHEYRRALSKSGDPRIVVSNHGNPKQFRKAGEHKVPAWIDQVVVPDYSPYALLWRAASARDVDVLYRGHQVFQGKDLVHLSVRSFKNDQQHPNLQREWYLDAQTMLPVYSVAATPTNENPYLRPVVRIAYSKYSVCGVHLCPMEQTHLVGDREILRLHLTSSEVGTTKPADDIFTSDKTP